MIIMPPTRYWFEEIKYYTILCSKPAGIVGSAPYNDRRTLFFDFEGPHRVDIFKMMYRLGRRRCEQLLQREDDQPFPYRFVIQGRAFGKEPQATI